MNLHPSKRSAPPAGPGAPRHRFLGAAVRALLGPVLLGLVSLPATVPAAVPSSPAPDAVVVLAPDAVVVLALEDAIELALRQELELKGIRLDSEAAHARPDIARSPFEPTVGAFLRKARQVQPRASELDARVAVTVTESFQTTFSQRFTHGASYELQLGANRLENNNPFIVLSPSYSADFQVRYSQPLLRGLGRRVNLTAVSQALNAAAAADLTLRARAAETVRSTIDAYWELVFAVEDLKVREASLQLADRLLRQNRIMVEVGTLAPIEIAQAEAAVAQRHHDIIIGRALVGHSEDGLRRSIGIPEDSPWWNLPLVPADKPEFEATWVDLREALEEALTRRDEPRATALQVESAELEVAAARNALRPSLTFDLTLSSAGLGGDQRAFVDTTGDTIPDTFVRISEGDLGDAFKNVRNRDFNSWSAQLTFGKPVFNRAAKAEHLVARLGLENRRLDLDRSRQAISLEVRRAVRDLESARERITAARATRELQEKKLGAEVKKFENGLSTNFEVLQFQTDLSQAESTELRAIVDHLKAAAALQRARGTLLDGRLAAADVPEAAGGP